MGQIIAYYRNELDTTPLEIYFRREYPRFRNLLLEDCSRYYKEYKEEAFQSHLIEFLKHHGSLPEYELIWQPILEDLLVQFAGGDDFSSGIWKWEAIGPWMSKSKYNYSTELVNKTMSKEFCRIWNYLIEGRPVSGMKDWGEEFYGRLGFWSYEEWSFLREEIGSHFRHFQNIDSFFWTEKEILKNRENYMLALKEGRVHEWNKAKTVDRDSYGLEFVMSSIKAMKDHKQEMVFHIEWGP